MYRKRKGFTLSEVIVYLGITSLILAIPTSFKIVKDRGYELKVEGEISKIHDFLIEAKQLSKKDNLSGKIVFDIAENKLRYQNKVRSTSLKLNEVKISNNLKNVIEITQMGMLNRSGTITITDKNKKRREITITTGLKKINVK
ncbi:TPA: prepilin-type N-terminal cleavage/methylation domain-containing protein [Clostridium perfringens]|uniref:prepilin-type N-terminal cleavage/methylation domain-containing protein n=1 Tax=Clostridium perfringens TaxID=1502 RepID=UPI000BBA569B|nr:prepilin-type N-terminal cleavage/methylation domain-containing protein [Clostridium perfringens]MCX0378477.1 prepilin-type N-terminal cleavage/methylation domain-containing protein [Clostridium perfringens]MDK0685825.1 prepilin-type N-terminal cleavage/methylation domain-containing protein [Clostridium perfringens]MDM0494131.1 prepilin-type N-terminal cleavage/methylation domain-containing protein [Clostridium perfringens]MDU7954403.1 prepilin-type N-terminal cleavage/methylation domain-con